MSHLASFSFLLRVPHTFIARAAGEALIVTWKLLTVFNCGYFYYSLTFKFGAD